MAAGMGYPYINSTFCGTPTEEQYRQIEAYNMAQREQAFKDVLDVLQPKKKFGFVLNEEHKKKSYEPWRKNGAI